MEGYNISTTIGGKTILGRTSDSLSISAKVKESLTKDDAGVTKKTVTGHDVTISCNGLCMLDSSNQATKLDRDDVMELALKKGSQAELTIVYGAASSDKYTGTAIITDFSEESSASADEEPSWSLTLSFTSELTKQVG